MAGSALMGLAGPQDLVYGFSPKNVAERLTSKNWRRKAVMRRDKHGELYIWVSRGKKEEDGKKRVVHSVSVERPFLEGDRRTIYERYFDGLEDALRYANGEDRSALSRNSRPLGRVILNEVGSQLLGGKTAPTTFSVMGTGHQVEISGTEDEGDPVKPDGYACFLTEVLESILEVSPGMLNYAEKHGISLHPDVEGRKSYGPKSDLPERITVRCHKSKGGVAGKFHVFPKERTAGGLMHAVRIDGPKGQAGKRALTARKKTLPKGQARS